MLLLSKNQDKIKLFFKKSLHVEKAEGSEPTLIFDSDKLVNFIKFLAPDASFLKEKPVGADNIDSLLLCECIRNEVSEIKVGVNIILYQLENEKYYIELIY